MQISLYSPIAWVNGAKFIKIRVVPTSILDLVELSLVVANHANFTVLTQNMCELREICSAHDQLLAFGVSTIDLLKQRVLSKSEQISIIDYNN